MYLVFLIWRNVREFPRGECRKDAAEICDKLPQCAAIRVFSSGWDENRGCCPILRSSGDAAEQSGWRRREVAGTMRA
ncbi:MAG: hypothetical protein AB7S55_05020 [Thiomonas sp.]